MGPRHDLSFCACTTSCLASELPVSMGPSPHLWLLHAKQRLWTRITNLYVSQRSSVVLCMLYSVICTRITSLCGTQTSPDVLCMQNNVPSIRITSLYVSQPSSVVFGCKTASFGPELQVSMGTRHDLSFCECTTTCLASELPVSMGPRPHLWFLDVKQRLLDQNNKSLWVPDLICGFEHT